ncbi:MAG: flagellar biosynthesis protein FliQ [Bdellovibrionales bacterium]|nr:flagellar biosynthesis protein FliQ [Bdellovibrionales bacterium]
MSDELVLNLSTQTLKTMALVAAPMLIAALVTGLIVSVFQAITQINEATLTFIPKMIIVAIVLVIAGPWMLDTLKGFTVEIFETVGTIVRTQ